MRITLAPGRGNNTADLGLIYAGIIITILAGTWFFSYLARSTGNEALAPLNLTQVVTCPLKNYTGIPCLTCGMTRSVVHLVHLEIAQAFLMNPVVFLTMLGLLLWGAYALVARLFKTRRIVIQVSGTERKIIILIFISILLVNWLYLILDGR